MNKRIVIAAVLGQLVGLLGYIDPLFIVLVLAGPLLTGAVAATRRVPLVLPVVVWASAGLNMLWMDWLILREDVVFHAVLSVIMSLLVALGYGIAVGVARLRGRVSA